MDGINFVAVIAAAVSTFAIGGLWYSPLLFQRQWMVASGVNDASLQKRNMAMVFVLAFVFAFLMAANLAAFLNAPGTTTAWGATAGALAGIGWVLPGIATVALFEGRSWSYTLVNGGYWAVSFVVMGAILGAWR